MPSAIEPPEGTEQRNAERASITLKVDYKRLNTFFADYTKNISKGGTFIRTNKPLEIGTEFVFELSFPGGKQLQLLGEVKWIIREEEATSDQAAGMGIKFKFKDDAERHAVEDFVEKLMKDTLGEHISQKLLANKKAT